MHASTQEHVLAEVAAARERAEAVLRGLLAAQQECEQYLEQGNRKDPIKIITGKSSLENAIAAARRMIDSFDRQVQEAARVSMDRNGDSPKLLPQIRVGAVRATMA